MEEIVTEEQLKHSKDLNLRLMKKVYNKRGYLVLWYESPIAIGTIIDTLKATHDSVEIDSLKGAITAETTKIDCEEQCKLAGFININSPDFGHYYRVLLD